MPARRTLHLGGAEIDKNEKSQLKSHPASSYSPVTGTRRMSPSSASKRRAGKGQKQPDVTKNAKSAQPEKSSRGQSPTDENCELLELFSQVEKSMEEFLKMRQSLQNLQALEGSGELENIIGKVHPALDLKTEMQKTKALICEVRKMKKQKTG